MKVWYNLLSMMIVLNTRLSGGGMSEEEGVVFVTASVYQRHRDLLDQYARKEGFSRSLALRKALDEWAALTGRAATEDAGADCEQ